MAGWNVRQLNPRDKVGEEEWSIDNGSDTLIAGVGQENREKAQRIADLLNAHVTARFRNPDNHKAINDLLGTIYTHAQELERQTMSLPKTPGSPFPAIQNRATALRDGSTELMKILLD